MLDDMYERDRPGDAGQREPRPSEGASPLSDREVPLAPLATTEVVHRWLDGEMAEPTGARGESARSVEFWRRVNDETDRRRRMVTPPHVAARIMASLPGEEASTFAASWWTKDFHLSPVAAAALVAGAFALGMLVMWVL